MRLFASPGPGSTVSPSNTIMQASKLDMEISMGDKVMKEPQPFSKSWGKMLARKANMIFP